MIIRRETEKDFAAIYTLVKVAFQTAKMTNGKEQDYVLELRAGGGYIPELALVAEEAGELIGHILFTRSYISEDGGGAGDVAGHGGAGGVGATGADAGSLGRKKFEVLYVAPLSVVLERREKGVGSALVFEGLRLAKGLGYKAVVLVGDPAYYHRFGFRTAADFGIGQHAHIPDANVMACELFPGALAGVSGKIDCF